MELCALCADLESSARTADLVDNGETLLQIEKCYEDVRVQLEAWRESLVSR